MNTADVAGDLVEATLSASIIEQPVASAIAPDGHTHETLCLNCGASLAGPFCHACGQAAHVHRTLGAFFHDLLHGVFHFEGRVWHTLPLLVLRPGQLTRRYIDGQRARFVSPLALFLFCVFLMFAAIQQTSDHEKLWLRDGTNAKAGSGAESVGAEIRQLMAERSALIAQHEDTSDIDTHIAGLRAVMAAVKPGQTTERGVPRTITGVPMLDAGIAKVKSNPELALYKIETHAYKYSWVLIPISVPFMWLLFPFSRRFKLYDHTVFITYSLSFMTLLCVAAILAGSPGWDTTRVFLFCVPPIHMYRQLRGAYGCSRTAAMVRTCGLLVIATIALLIFTTLLVAESEDVPLIQVS